MTESATHNDLTVEDVLDLIKNGVLSPRTVTFEGEPLPTTHTRRALKRNVFDHYGDDQVYTVTISDYGNSAAIERAK